MKYADLVTIIKDVCSDLTLSSVARAIVEATDESQAREIARLINYYL